MAKPGQSTGLARLLGLGPAHFQDTTSLGITDQDYRSATYFSPLSPRPKQSIISFNARTVNERSAYVFKIYTVSFPSCYCCCFRDSCRMVCQAVSHLIIYLITFPPVQGTFFSLHQYQDSKVHLI